MSFRPQPFRVIRARPVGCSRTSLPIVIPAQAGIHFHGVPKSNVDSRLRGNDAWLKVLADVEGCK